MTTQIAIIDYGMGNRRSVEKAFLHVGASVDITADPETILSADGVVIVGVGAFPEAMRRLRAGGFDDLLRKRIELGRPVLGICLGLQLFFEHSEEHEGSAGLGFLSGTVRRIPANGNKVPHIGWNTVAWSRPTALTDGLPQDAPLYHLHSYAATGVDPDVVVGSTTYGEEFVTAVEKHPLYGVQFHPEKSADDGLKMIRNFARICAPQVPEVQRAA